jgi:hypothetical protein
MKPKKTKFFTILIASVAISILFSGCNSSTAETITFTWQADTKEKVLQIGSYKDSEITINWGDGSSIEKISPTALYDTLKHAYKNDGTYSVTISAKIAPSIWALKCSGCLLSVLKFEGCSALTELDCSNNQLTELTLTGCVKLEDLKCNDNLLSILVIEDCIYIKKLNCDNNQLSNLDVSNNGYLEYLSYGRNSFIMEINEDDENIEPLDCVSNLDSLRGKVKSITENYYYLKDDSALVFEKNEEESIMRKEYYYNISGWLTRCIRDDESPYLYKYDNEGRLVEKYKQSDFERSGKDYVTTYKYDKSRKLMSETFHYHDGYSQTEYIYNEAGKLIEDRTNLDGGDGQWTEVYAYDNFKVKRLKEEIFYNDYSSKIPYKAIYYYKNWKEEVRYDEEGYETSRILEKKEDKQVEQPRYNAKGEMLLSGHSFQCTFDKFGNWTSKVDAWGDTFIIIERKIEYYE